MQSIPFLSLAPQHDRIREELERAFKNVLDGGKLILASEVEAFEKEYAAFSGVQHCIAVANGLDALFISLKLLGIGKGDQVIVPALTCAPTWMAVSRTDATLVPVDADPGTFNMSVSQLNQLITNKTKAIVPVNLYGRPADLPAVLRITDNKNIFIVEDNAQGHGASIQGRPTGSFGILNATSFYPTKNLGALGDGGAITTNDSRYAEKARRYRNYGTTKRFQHDEIGINSRLDELQAAFLRVKLKYLEAWNDERSMYAALLQNMLEGVGDLIMPKNGDGMNPAHHLFVICTAKRNALKEFLTTHGVGTDVHYPVPPHLQGAYRFMGFAKGSFPVTEKICDTILSLPLWPGMGEESIKYVGSCVKKFF